jgi:hypothetical protein
VKLGGRGTLLVVVSIVVAVAIATSFLLLGTPQEARKLEIDRQRLEDLMAIANDVRGIYNAADGGQTLLDSLPETAEPWAPNLGRRDPVTNEPYAYRKLAPDRFELCATFDMPAEDDPRNWEGGWGHPAGRVCFEFGAGQVIPLRPSAVRKR